MVTASAKPEETVYLRGFIGADYDGISWRAGDAAAFDSAASNWKDRWQRSAGHSQPAVFARGLQWHRAPANDCAASACK